MFNCHVWSGPCISRTCPLSHPAPVLHPLHPSVIPAPLFNLAPPMCQVPPLAAHALFPFWDVNIFPQTAACSFSGGVAFKDLRKLFREKQVDKLLRKKNTKSKETKEKLWLLVKV